MPAIEQPPVSRQEGRPALSYVEGLFTNLLNPKVALFYLTFLPQFISPGDPVIARSLLLAGIHAALGVIWLTVYAYFVSKLSELLNRPRVKRNIERVTGALLVGFGLRLVWEQR
jgi:threonine/homoserine/homoserine lactone efflux protein